MKIRRTLALDRVHTFEQVLTKKAHHFQGQRVIKNRSGLEQPLVQGTFGKSVGIGRSGCDLRRHFHGFVEQFVIASAEADQTNTFRLGSLDEIARQQVILGFRHTAQQRPDDSAVITGCNSEACVSVSQSGTFGHDTDV